MGKLLDELKRRKVFKVGAVYAVAAWVRPSDEPIRGNNQCSGWNYPISNVIGLTIIPEFGKFVPSGCEKIRPVACCAPVP